MSILIIAPTHGYYRDPAQKPINDTIKDPENSVNILEKTNSIVPESANKAPKGTKLNRYHDMRATHIGVKNADYNARKFYENFDRVRDMNGVAFPVNDDSANSRYISLAYRHR